MATFCHSDSCFAFEPVPLYVDRVVQWASEWAMLEVKGFWEKLSQGSTLYSTNRCLKKHTDLLPPIAQDPSLIGRSLFKDSHQPNFLNRILLILPQNLEQCLIHFPLVLLSVVRPRNKSPPFANWQTSKS